MIDLGEIVISHPFFSLLNFHQQMKKHHELKESDEIYQRLHNACFVQYKRYFANANDFNDALAIAKGACQIFRVVYQEKFIQACGKENLKQYNHWKFPQLFATFMKTLEN